MVSVSWVDVGVDIGGTKMVLVARDADGVLVDELRVPIGPSASPADLERIIRSFTSALAAPLRTVAIAVPGLVAPGGAVVVSDVLPGIAGWRPEVASARRPPFVVNDVRASLAYATTVSGSTDVLCVVAGTGIAAAFTNSSTAEPFHGGDGWAGELGYLPTPLADGRWGTLDDAASGAALLRRLGLAPAEVLRRIESGDQEVIAERACRRSRAGPRDRFVRQPAEPQGGVPRRGHVPLPGLRRCGDRRRPHRQPAAVVAIASGVRLSRR